MNEAQALAEIVQTLTVDHGCHAVILYGARARGDFQPTSDWDVAGIREAGATAPLRVPRAFHGAWLDAFVYPERRLSRCQKSDVKARLAAPTAVGCRQWQLE